jgi:hypothetical protein
MARDTAHNPGLAAGVGRGSDDEFATPPLIESFNGEAQYLQK